ncbi:hypothetical protein ABT084_11260 [Streptomyces sp. NPDC002138]|uniref:hypothetical protein n=1 Tax=Streptomyces sp. NPDC002138 TaxID=3154410 RepID=UPI003331A03E
MRIVKQIADSDRDKVKKMAFKKVVVKLHHIFNESTGDDPGSELEIFGRFDAARLAFNPDIGEVIPLVSSNLFDRSSDHARDIEEGTALIVDTSAEFDIFNGEFLQIAGHLSEQDTFGPDDHLGSVDLRIPFNSISTGLVDLGVFEESGQRVSVKLSATMTAQG